MRRTFWLWFLYSCGNDSTSVRGLMRLNMHYARILIRCLNCENHISGVYMKYEWTLILIGVRIIEKREFYPLNSNDVLNKCIYFLHIVNLANKRTGHQEHCKRDADFNPLPSLGTLGTLPSTETQDYLKEVLFFRDLAPYFE